MFFWIIGLLIYLFRIQWVEFKGRSLLSGRKDLANELREKGINIRGWQLVDRVDQNGGLAFEVVLIHPYSILYNLTFKFRKKYLVSKKNQVAAGGTRVTECRSQPCIWPIEETSKQRF